MKPVSDELWSAINATICCHTKRLPVADLLQHSLMKLHNIPVADMRGHTPPFIPALNGEADTSYFDNSDTEQQKADQVDLEKMLSGSDVPWAERNTGEFAYFTWKAFPEDLKQQIEKHPHNRTVSCTAPPTSSKDQAKNQI